MLSTDRVFDCGQGSVRPALFRDVEGRAVYNSVDQLMAKLGVQEAIDDREQAMVDLGDRLDTLSDRVNWGEVQHAKTEAELKKTVEKQNSAIEGVNSTIELHSETLRALFYHMRVLESVALNYRPLAVALTVRSHLDDARYCVAEGILTAFPGLYIRDLIMDNHDPLGKSVYWRSFRSSITAHFWRYHGLVKMVGRGKPLRGHEVIQRESVFADCYARRLYMIGPLAHKPIAKNEFALSAVTPHKFEYKLVATFPPKSVVRGRLVESHNDDIMKLTFNFMLPALVWAYTELKKHIIRGDSIIQALEKRNAKQRYLKDHPVELVHATVPMSYDVEMENRFAHGTALEVRKEERWRTYNRSLDASDIDEGRKLYNYWLEDEDVYATIEREEEIQAEADRVAWEAAFPHRASARAFVPPDNGIKHTSSTRVISASAGRKRGGSDIDGLQSGESPSKARKATGSCPTPSRVRDEEEEALNVNNAVRALSEDETKLETAQKRRRIHVARLTSIYKCLSILLDPDLVEFAILGESDTRHSLNDTAHPTLSYDILERDSIERGFELVDKYRRSARARSAGEASTSEEPTATYYSEQTSKLLNLLGKGDEELRCFDDPNVTMPMEVALDKHLSGKAHVGPEPNGLAAIDKDIRLIMSYLGDVRPTESD